MLLDGVELLDDDGRPVREPSAIEADASEVRSRMAPRPVEGQIKTPDSMIAELEWARYGAARMAKVVRDAEKTYRAARRAYDRRFVVQVKKAEARSEAERKLETDAQLVEYIDVMDAAEVALEYARRVAKGVEGSTSAIQTQARLVLVTYELGGVGKG